MVRRLLAAVPVIALSVALVASNDAAAANACKKDCTTKRKAAFSDANTAKKACIAAAPKGKAGKTQRKACIATWKAAKATAKQTFNPKTAGCKANPSATCGSTTTTTLPTGTCTGTTGNPVQLSFTVPATGSDLDNGTTGLSHNFPIVHGSTLTYCLSNCDATTDSTCDASGTTGAGTTNTQFFGAPLPLLSSGVPVCVVNEFVDKTVTGTVDLATGAMSTDVKLTSKVFVRPGQASLVCPRCTGDGTLGSKGKCNGGANNGKDCTVNGLINVSGSTPADYQVSTDCPPEGQGIGLAIDLPLTTQSATPLNGPKPCPGQTVDDACGTATCSADCSATSDPKGGINQLCCSGGANNGRPCFPTKSGSITRTGSPSIPQPAWPDPTYPKTTSSDAKLVATFCIAATGDATVDGITGLPGPGAIILPGTVVVQSAQ